MADAPQTQTTDPVAQDAAIAPAAPVADAPPAAPDPAPAQADPPAAAEGESGVKPTLLERFDADNAPAEAAKDDKAAPAAPEAKPEPPAPVEYKYEAPEGISLTDEARGEIASALDAFRANPIEGAQGLLDLHAKFINEAVTSVRNDQTEVFNNTVHDWEKAVLADPIIGGAGHETAMRAVARARDFALSSVPQDQREPFRADFEHFLRVTGAGSHPAFLKFVHAFSPLVDEGREVGGDIMPPRDIGKAPPGAKRSGNGLYDHPRGTADT